MYITMNNKVKSCKGINDKVQTANFSDFTTRGRKKTVKLEKQKS